MGRPRINPDHVLTVAERSRAYRARLRAERKRREDDDNFRSPAEAVPPLLGEVSFPGVIWEPCAGEGYLARYLRAAGFTVVATTLIDYGAPDVEVGVDFLKQTVPPPGVQTIISNAPYRRNYGSDFIRHALTIPGILMSAWLVPIGFMTSEKRYDLHRAVTRTITFGKRLPRMHRRDFHGAPASATDDFMWLIYLHDQPGNGVAPNRYWEG